MNGENNMKKFLMALCGAGLIFGLAGCKIEIIDKSDKVEDEVEDKVEGDQFDTLEGFLSYINGSEVNCEGYMTMESFYEEYGLYIKSHNEYKQDGNITYTKETTTYGTFTVTDEGFDIVLGETESSEYYEVLDGDKKTIYTLGEDGSWTYTETYSFGSDDEDLLEEDFKLNEDGTYSLVDGMPGYFDVIITLGDDAKMDSVIDMGVMTMSSSIYNFTKVNLTLPEATPAE